MMRLGIHLLTAARSAALNLTDGKLRADFCHGRAKYFISTAGPDSTQGRYLGTVDWDDRTLYLYAQENAKVRKK
jgi:hypothetical protein